MSNVTAEKTVGELVAEKPSRSRVFERHGIDYCCSGKRTLPEACAAHGAPLEQVLKDLEVTDAAPESFNPAELSMTELIRDIVEKHHAYLEQELPRLRQMAARVAEVHGPNDTRLPDLAQVVNGLVKELSAHMAKEERVLFPVIEEMDRSGAMPATPFGSLANPINAMEAEHSESGGALERMRELTDGYTPPDWACNTYRALLDGLRELEEDLHTHIHKENNILFPRALEAEVRLQ